MCSVGREIKRILCSSVLPPLLKKFSSLKISKKHLRLNNKEHYKFNLFGTRGYNTLTNLFFSRDITTEAGTTIPPYFHLSSTPSFVIQ